jgi:hypothetical protein
LGGYEQSLISSKKAIEGWLREDESIKGEAAKPSQGGYLLNTCIMRILEFLDQQALQTAYYDPSQDTAEMRVPTDTRKPKLSLAQLARLRHIRAMKKLEQLKREDVLELMYSVPDEGEGGMGMGGAPGGGF